MKKQLIIINMKIKQSSEWIISQSKDDVCHILIRSCLQFLYFSNFVRNRDFL